MIILDTNVISEMMKPKPSRHVITWIDQQNIDELFLTTITIAEISYGLHVLPAGKRRILLERSFDKAITTAFEHRILHFNESTARFYGQIMGNRKKLGRPMSVLDGQIAAIAQAYNATIATRNIRDFTDCNMDLVNPFESTAHYK